MNKKLVVTGGVLGVVALAALAGGGGGEPTPSPVTAVVATATPEPTPTEDFASEEPVVDVSLEPVETSEPTAEPTPKPVSFATALKEAKSVKYKTLFRNSEDYLFESIKFKGEVIQTIDEDDGSQSLRVDVTKDKYGYWDDTVLIVGYNGKRILEDDIIQFVATYTGPFTYESTLGADITIPGFILGDALIKVIG